MSDWSKLRPTQRGVAVEGKNDKGFVEAFLDVGERQGLWQDWRNRLVIDIANNYDNVLKEVIAYSSGQVYGIIDRDWRTDTEVAELAKDHPNLIVLPRIMIENYCIDPDDVLAMLPAVQRNRISNEATFRTQIEAQCQDWIKHGALSGVLYENGAHEFCRGTTGYPRALLDSLITDEQEILNRLHHWHHQLDPSSVLGKHKTRMSEFQGKPPKEQYMTCINGKMFFNQVIVPGLNHALDQQDRDTWLLALVQSAPICPKDLAQLLQRLFI